MSVPTRIGILPGSFNPPTIAHVGLLEAAAPRVDELVCAVPRNFPHKEYFGATLEERLELLEAAAPALPVTVVPTTGGLFVEIAREIQAMRGGSAELYMICGADAADRIMNWDYGRPGVAEEMLGEFQLLVAPRVKLYEAPGHLRERIRGLELAPGHQVVSSTEVRDRIAAGQAWEHLVPGPIVERVRRIYSR